MAMLVGKNGPRAGESIPLEGTEWLIGRHPDCDVVVDENSISRQHARLIFDGENFLIKDLESRNKTYINNALVRPESPQPLRHGDELKLCEIAFQFFIESPDEPQLAPFFIEQEPDSIQSTISSRFGLQNLSDSSRLMASPAVTLEALIEISRALGRALSLDEVLPQVLNSMFRIFLQADRGFIALKDEQGNLVPRWSKTRREDMGEFRVSRAIATQAMSQKEAFLSIDAATDERFDMSQSVADFRIRSMMCVPLLDSDEEPMGILQLDTIDQRKRFQESDLEVLAAIATQASIAIDNARLHEQTLQQRAVQRDLELAREVQSSFLPSQRPNLEGFEFFDFYQPANHVGGDYFDYIQLPDNRLAVVVADVVGHGVAAALLMAKLSAEFRYCVATYHEPGTAITQLNRRLAEIPGGRFITLVMAMIEQGNDEVEIVNAGHMPPILRSSSGVVREVVGNETHYPLGIIDDSEYQAIVTRVEPGELMLLFTDGLHEASNANEEILGLEKVQEGVARAGGHPEQTVNDLVQLAKQHAEQQDDDMCLVAVKRHP